MRTRDHALQGLLTTLGQYLSARAWRLAGGVLGCLVLELLYERLTPALLGLGWARWTGDVWEVGATGTGLVRVPYLWPLVALGVLAGWGLGRLEGLWTGAQTAAADLYAARQALDRDTARFLETTRETDARLAQGWAALAEAQAQVQQAREAADAAQREAATAPARWQAWATEQISAARAQAADAERRRRNAAATAERRARQLARVRERDSARPHPAS